MAARKLRSQARIVLILNALYNTAYALCSVFVGVYLYVHSLDFLVVCGHYLAMYLSLPAGFLLAGWYAQARDRIHVFQLGLLFHGIYFGTLLWLKQDSVNYAIPLGMWLGLTWGFFWTGNHTFTFDATNAQEREYFFGWFLSATGTAKFVAPIISGLLIYWSADAETGYQIIFFTAILLFAVSILLSRHIHADLVRRPFRIGRALFPPRENRDWRLVLLAAISMAGSVHIFHFLLGLVLYMQISNEAAVGAFAGFQAFASIAVAYTVGRLIIPRWRMRTMLVGVSMLASAGVIVLIELNSWTLIALGFFHAIAVPLFTIPFRGIQFGVIEATTREPGERIDYICAWEISFALGRCLMLGILVLLVMWNQELGLRIGLFLLCVNRMGTYFLLRRVSIATGIPAKLSPAPPETSEIPILPPESEIPRAS